MHRLRPPAARLTIIGIVLAAVIGAGLGIIPVWAYPDALSAPGNHVTRLQDSRRRVRLAEKSDFATASNPSGQPGQPTSTPSARASPAPRRHHLARRARLQRSELLIHDSPRRAHSIAAQGGINAAKTTRTGDSIQRLFYDTIKGGDYRSREANVYRLAQTSVSIIDQCVAQGVPRPPVSMAGCSTTGRSAARRSRARSTRAAGPTACCSRDQSTTAGRKRHGHVAAQPACSTSSSSTGRRARRRLPQPVDRGDRALRRACGFDLCTGGYGTAYDPVDECGELERHRGMARPQAPRLLRQPTTRRFIPPSVSGTHQSKLTLMQRSPRNDGRVWVPKHQGDSRRPEQIPEAEQLRPHHLERRYPSFGNLVPRDVASRNAKAVCDEGRGVGEAACVVPGFRRSRSQAPRRGRDQGRATAICSTCTRRLPTEDPDRMPMRIDPAIHYTMVGLVGGDYNLMEHDPRPARPRRGELLGLRCQSAGRQCPTRGSPTATSSFPTPSPTYLGSNALPAVSTDHDAFREAEAFRQERIDTVLAVRGSKTPRELHRELGQLL